jgi:hypothetical protein
MAASALGRPGLPSGVAMRRGRAIVGGWGGRERGAALAAAEKRSCDLAHALDVDQTVLGTPRLRSDHPAPGRRLADPRALTHRP